MNKHLRNLGFLVILVSCNPQESARIDTDRISRSISESYKPPVFNDDLREEKIRSLTQDIHQLIEDHAKAENIPGILVMKFSSTSILPREDSSTSRSDIRPFFSTSVNPMAKRTRSATNSLSVPGISAMEKAPFSSRVHSTWTVFNFST